MPLFLKAEQKNLLSFFGTDERYIIPAFQRPYSWGYEQCDRLYNDLAAAFNSSHEYFLGNVVIASAQNDNLRPHIIDGQQRLITLFMIAKILTILQPEYVKFSRLIFVEDDKGLAKFPKMESEVPESNDNDLLEKILKMNLNEIINRLDEIKVKNIVVPEKCEGKIETNFLTLFSWYYGYKTRATEDEFGKYLDFFFRKIYILPITLDGKTQMEAESDALTIFETINDRGLSLQDADIIKALLYKKAKQNGEDHIFIKEWHSLKIECLDLGLSIDDLFRYYYYLLKEADSSSSNSNRLRDYFVRNPQSPIQIQPLKQTLHNLKRIVEILQYLSDVAAGNVLITVPLQILNSYTNQYPRYAIVAYIYEIGINKINELEFHAFLTSLIRLSYGSGSTTAIKSEIFNIIRSISRKEPIKKYYFSKEIDVLNTQRVFPLRRGMMLLSLWLEYPNREFGQDFDLDRVIPRRDLDDEEPLGNFFMIYGPKKRGDWYRKADAYNKSRNKIFTMQFDGMENKTPREIVLLRNKTIHNVLSNFFYGEN